MKNDNVLPPLPSQLYIFSNSESQVPESKILNELDQSITRQVSGPSSSRLMDSPSYFCSKTNYQNDTQGYTGDHPTVLCRMKQVKVPQCDILTQSIQNSRKRQRKNRIDLSPLKKHRNDDPCFQAVPGNRSKTLSGKITALQKLVSPYGKMDTASVLQEASVYVNLLHRQIKNMFEIMNSFHSNNLRPRDRQNIEEKQVGLRSRGLCVAPASIARKLLRENQCEHEASYAYKAGTS